MPETSSWITRLQTLIRSECADADFKVGLFGSCLRCESPGDIDLLIVYTNGTKLNRVLEYRERIRLLVRTHFGLGADFCTLSEREADTNSFAQDEGVVMLEL